LTFNGSTAVNTNNIDGWSCHNSAFADGNQEEI
jgi:hypothetical protein